MFSRVQLKPLNFFSLNMSHAINFCVRSLKNIIKETEGLSLVSFHSNSLNFFSQFFMWRIFCMVNIGGHGFWDKGGVDTGGCPQKNFPAAFGGRKIFRRRRHRGVKIFFRWGVYLVDRGVILPKNPKKWPHRGVKIFFPRGASHPGVHPPLFFSRRVSGKFSA